MIAYEGQSDRTSLDAAAGAAADHASKGTRVFLSEAFSALASVADRWGAPPSLFFARCCRGCRDGGWLAQRIERALHAPRPPPTKSGSSGFVAFLGLHCREGADADAGATRALWDRCAHLDWLAFPNEWTMFVHRLPDTLGIQPSACEYACDLVLTRTAH